MIIFGIEVSRTLHCPTVDLSPCKSAQYDHNSSPSQTDRQTNRRTDEDNGVTATMRSSIVTHRALKTNVAQSTVTEFDYIQS